MLDCDLDVTTDIEVHHTNDDNDVNTNNDADTEVLHDKGGVSNTDHDDNTTNVPIATEIVEVPTTSVRKTSRIVKEPVWMKDYAVRKQSSTRHPLVNSLSDRATSCYKVFVTKFSECIEPKHFHQVVKDDRWIQAIQQDIKSLEENNA